MKRSKKVAAISGQINPAAGMQAEDFESPIAVADNIDDDRRLEDGEPENESFFYGDGGSIFGGTSLIDDALLRAAIGGRFR